MEKTTEERELKVHPSISEFVTWCQRFELKPYKIESILLYKDYQKLCTNYQKLFQYQIKSISPRGVLLFYTKSLPKVKEILKMAIDYDIDVELNVVEFQPHKKPKTINLTNTKIYRELGVI